WTARRPFFRSSGRFCAWGKPPLPVLTVFVLDAVAPLGVEPLDVQVRAADPASAALQAAFVRDQVDFGQHVIFVHGGRAEEVAPFLRASPAYFLILDDEMGIFVGLKPV